MHSTRGTNNRGTRRLAILLGSLCIAIAVALGGPTGVSLAAPLALGTSPTLSELLGYSVLGGGSVTNTGLTVTEAAVGVSPGSSITGFPPGSAGGSGIHSNDSSAIAAQAETLSVFGALDQPCDTDWTGTGTRDLAGLTLVPGVYCADDFGLTGTLTLSGGADEVYIFKAATTLITGPGSSVVGGDPCDIWWRIGSSTTLNTTTSFIGTVISQTGDNAMQTDANLMGRFLALSGATVTLDDNTITNPVCLGAPAVEEAVSGLPDTGGAPIQDGSFPWSLVIVGGVSAAALALGVRAYRRSYLPK
jgi:hypothetical protein